VITNALTGIVSGHVPPPGGGFGTFSFCGGSFTELLATSGCPVGTSAFYYNKPNGGWAVWIPASTVAVVNAEILGILPSLIPGGTIFTAKCV
jgi:hypothetical protein